MRLGPVLTVGMLLGVALALPACGDEETTAAGTPTTTVSARSTSAQCGRLLGDFLDSVESLNNALAVGLSYTDYLSAVDNSRAAYASVPVERLPIACLGRVGYPAERALDNYIAAANRWGRCLATASCATSEVEPALKRSWAGASHLLSRAKGGMNY
jgi:hypothetical protein